MLFDGSVKGMGKEYPSQVLKFLVVILGPGKNSVFDDPQRLSYCVEDAIMIGIVRGQALGHHEFDTTIYGKSG
ncbi:hypothetical protein PSHT_00871 [Puccinia striiformis]|uniref:Uncharacterized protein n=1 Tax=Puccinia striiformis TaxID=27350 RepID=A0A2S4WM95_9BASI|nr:hypothetical protein PSHT_00871 [Puccinia striiformis]